MTGYWLLKTEPGTYSYSDLQRDGFTSWDGVRNNLALIHLRNMRKGDRAFIYHTGTEKRIVGIAEITSDPYPDPTAQTTKLVVVDLKPLAHLERPVPLSELKTISDFKDFELLTISRLGVMPVSRTRWERILSLSREGKRPVR